MYVQKEENTSTIVLINDEKQKINFSAHKYSQGREKNLYGSPYTITVGIPLHEDNSTTVRQVKDQKNLIQLYKNKYIHPNDIFSSANFLIVMLNHGSKSDYLAWNKGHHKVLLEGDKYSQVSNITS